MNPRSSAERPVRLRERLKDETVRSILAAAEEVLSEEGLGARMERIAARAGVAVGTLYNHFEDRDALCRTLSRTRREALLARVDEALAATAGQPVEGRLRAMLAALGEHARVHGRYLAVLVQSGDGPARAHPPNTLVDDLNQRAESVIEAGIASGELRADGRHLYAAALVGMARAVVVQALRRGQDDPAWSGMPDAVVELFLRGAAR